jgi:hypothetical protein
LQLLLIRRAKVGSRIMVQAALQAMPSSVVNQQHSLVSVVPATSLQHSMKSPSAFFMMLALCRAVTFWRLLSVAYLNAYSATRVLATRVITCAGEATGMCAHVTCETYHSHVLCYYWTNSVLQAEITHYPLLLLLLLLLGLGTHAPLTQTVIHLT